MKKGIPGMMSKRITAVMLSLLMMVSAVPVEALADDEPLTEITEVSEEVSEDAEEIIAEEISEEITEKASRVRSGERSVECLEEMSEGNSEEISEEALSESGQETQFRLTLFSNYGTGMGYLTKTGENGSYTLTGNEFSREGWVIVGWSSSSSGEVEYAYNATIDLTQRDVWLYAVWEHPGQLYLYANYDTAYPAYITKTSTTGSYTLSGNEISREGWAIAGWSDTPDGEIKCAKNATIHLRGDVTLYAIWAKQSCTITYYKNNEQATGNSSITEHVNGGNSCRLEVQTYSNPFCYANHYLAGWATSADGELKYRNFERIVVLGDMDLYAVWRQSPIGDIEPVTSSDSVYIGGILWKTIGVDAAGEQALLISDDTVDTFHYDPSAGTNPMSDCSRIYAGFTDAEKAAVCSTVKRNDPSYHQYEGADLTGTDGTGEKLFLLSASEAETYFSGSAARALDVGWWLRSPVGGGYCLVLTNGVLSHTINGDYGLRPAFVLDQSEILLRSAAEGDKSSAPTDGSSFGTFRDGGTGAKKLTLPDSDRDEFSAAIAEASGTSIRVSYSGAQTGEKEYISAMLLDPDGDIIGYASTEPISRAEGTWDITLPSDLDEGDYTLKIFNEQQNGDNETDYASPICGFAITLGEQTVVEEATPAAIFNATGPDCGTLTDVTIGMEYSLDGGSSWTDITGTSVTIASGVTVAKGIKVRKPGNGTTIIGSDVQTIEVTQAEAPEASSFTTTACSNENNSDGMISGFTPDMEFKRSVMVNWDSGFSGTVYNFLAGTYYIRIKGSGTMLASTYVEVTVAAFGTPSQVAAPSFSPVAGTYTEVQNVTISSATEGVSIYYTTNGENPTASSTLYSGAIRVSQTTTIKAIAVKSGMTDSSVSTAVFTISSDTPPAPCSHEYDEGVTAKEPTIFAEGMRIFTCTKCGDTYTVPIPRLKHENDVTDLVKDITDGEGTVNAAVETTDKPDGSKETSIKVGGKEIEKTVTDASGATSAVTEIWIGGLESEYTYTGSAIKPAVHVYDGTKKLTSSDYTVSYSDNKNAGTKATVTVSFKGSYKGTASKTLGFTIKPAVLGTDVTADDLTMAVPKKEKKPAPVCTFAANGAVIDKKNFEITYKDKDGKDVSSVKTAGTYTVTIKPANTNFTESMTATLTITADKKKLLSEAKVEWKKSKVTYTGAPIEPTADNYSLKLNGETLKKGTDYEVTDVRNNVKPGKAVIEFMAVEGNAKGLVGTKTASFTIKKGRELKKGDGFTYEFEASVPYTKGGAKPSVVVKDGENVLTAGKDYTVSYSGHTKVTSDATAVMTIKGKGNYKKSVSFNYTVRKPDLDGILANGGSISVADKTESKKGFKKPSVTILDVNGEKLKAGKDYEIDASSYTGPAADGTVTAKINGKGNYGGYTMITYRYIKSAQSLSKVKAKSLKDKAFTGRAVTLTEADLTNILYTGSKESPTYLKPGVDFIVLSYSKNTKKGTAKVKLQGIGSYGATKTLSFKITAKKGSCMGALVDGEWKTK